MLVADGGQRCQAISLKPAGRRRAGSGWSMVIQADRAWVRGFWRFLLTWKFRLFQQHRHRRLTLEHVDGMPILVLPDVFNPSLFWTSEALIRRLDSSSVRPGMAVLDMGTGSGVGAIAAARLGARVVAIDINPEAVRCARINALLNGVEERVDVRCGDLLAPVSGERFDLVLFNPPFYAGSPREPWEYAWRSDNALDRFARDLGDVLSRGGRALVVVSSATAGVEEAITRHGVQSQVVWKRDLIHERLMVLEWKGHT